jgi:predicted Zn-dependent peptidase
MSFSPEFNKTELANGVTVVTEHHPHSQALSIGAWVENGTRDEPRHLVGVSHLVEHLVFKGTRKRTSYQIARALEAVGGDLNAFTTRECTCFHAISLKEDGRLSLEVLCDLLSHATFEPDDFEKEKQVVIQELLMSTDNLEDYIFDLFFEKAYGLNPLARSILGSEQSLHEMSRRQVYDYYRTIYAGGPLIISAAGHLEHERVVEWVRSFLGTKKRHLPRQRRSKPRLLPIREVVAKPAEQVHILLALPVAKFRDPTRFESYVVNTLIGGGMTSKLYQNIRERRGLVYSIYSQLQSFTDTGLLTIYAATEPRHVHKVVGYICDELNKIHTRGISAADLKLFKTQVKGSVLLGADDVENRMNSLGVNEMVFGEYRSVDAVIGEINQVTVESVNAYIRKYLRLDQMAVMLLGGVASAEKETAWLEQI